MSDNTKENDQKNIDQNTNEIINCYSDEEKFNDEIDVEINILNDQDDENKFLKLICDNSQKIFILNLMFLIFMFAPLLYFTIAEAGFNNKFILNQFLKYIFLVVIQYIMALVVVRYNFKVNYTRKIVHMSFFLWPQILDNLIIIYQKDKYTELWNVWIILFLLFINSKEIRSKIKFIETMFKAVDRPEDQPYTLIWFATQVISTLVVLIPFSVFFSRNNKKNLVFIPILINALGDGLAEPVGIKFGKNKYKTKACCSKRVYERSYEGSFCVFIVSFIIILSFIPYMYINQFLFSLMTIPISSTIAEAFSPHTWDSPIITLVVCSLLSVSIYMKN